MVASLARIVASLPLMFAPARSWLRPCELMVASLGAHGRVLGAHGRVLGVHGRVVDSAGPHGRALGAQGRVLRAFDATFAANGRGFGT